MKHAKERIKDSYSLYLDKTLMDYVINNIKGVSPSQFINDILDKEVMWIKSLDNLYKREVVKNDEDSKRMG